MFLFEIEKKEKIRSYNNNLNMNHKYPISFQIEKV